jgi:hypothetical protein
MMTFFQKLELNGQIIIFQKMAQAQGKHQAHIFMKQRKKKKKNDDDVKCAIYIVFFVVASLGVRVKILEDLVKDRDSRIAALEMAIKIAELKLATSNSNSSAAEEEDEQGGEIIHLKGFGKSIPQSDVNDKAADAVIEYVVSCNPRMIAWDGDSYSTSSFTKLIPPLRGRLPKCEFVAFLREEDQKRFYSSWGNIMDKSVYRYDDCLLKNHSPCTLSHIYNACV